MRQLAAAVDVGRTRTRVRGRVSGRVAETTRPRVSASQHATGRGSRPGRTARWCRSRAAAVTTRGFDGARRIGYLNNRYYDPATGEFLSVDPLVTSTGDPYLYAAGNPTTKSDPSGLEPGCGPSAPAGSCAQAHLFTDAAAVGISPSNALAADAAGVPLDIAETAFDSPYMPQILRTMKGNVVDSLRYFDIFHNTVVADIVASSGGMRLLPAPMCQWGREQPDLCTSNPAQTLKAGGVVGVAEVKPNTASSVAGGLNQLAKSMEKGGDFVFRIGDPENDVSWEGRPDSGATGVLGMIGITLSWRLRSPGLYTYSIEGDLTRLPPDPVNTPTLVDVFRWLASMGLAGGVGAWLGGRSGSVGEPAVDPR